MKNLRSESICASFQCARWLHFLYAWIWTHTQTHTNTNSHKSKSCIERRDRYAPINLNSWLNFNYVTISLCILHLVWSELWTKMDLIFMSIIFFTAAARGWERERERARTSEWAQQERHQPHTFWLILNCMHERQIYRKIMKINIFGHRIMAFCAPLNVSQYNSSGSTVHWVESKSRSIWTTKAIQICRKIPHVI